MKKILGCCGIMIALVMPVLLASCKKSFLEVDTKGKLIAKSTNDYQLLLTNLDLITVSTDAQVPMGDEMAAVDPYFSGTDLRTQRLFEWTDVIYQPGEDAPEIQVPMRNIYLFNKVINEVMESTGGTDQEKASIQAQAMAARAWTYFLLINYYGKPYLESTASADPGFPVIKEADVTETQFTRASVKEVYDFIVNDLTTAIPNLPAQITHRLRMSKGTAEGILGKVYMFMGKFSEALPLLNASISDLASGTVPVRLYDYNVTFGAGGSFLPIGLFGPTYPTVPNNEENVFAKQFINNWSFINNELVINPQTVALYGSSDLRKKFYSKMPFPAGAPYPAGMLRRIGPIAVQFGLVLPDLYLLQAECKARLNDLPGAKAAVEALREKRMPPADAPVDAAIAGDQSALVNFILEERIREFAGQGSRWFDMRRLSVDPDYSNTVGTVHNVYTGGAVSNSFTLTPQRLVLQFPQKIMDQNPALENNP